MAHMMHSASTHVLHPIPPVFDEHSRILILGSFPSVKSRESAFFYGHPRNRFWQLLATLLGTDVPTTVVEKRTLLLTHRIALWDVLAACDIAGSADSTIRNPVPNDLSPILTAAPITAIFTNGAAAKTYYDRYTRPHTLRDAIPLPSTSPANAAMSFPTLALRWACVRDALDTCEAAATAQAKESIKNNKAT